MTSYRYQGEGAFVPGIPRRDLDEADVARLTKPQREAVDTIKHNGKRVYVKKSGGSTKASDADAGAASDTE